MLFNRKYVNFLIYNPFFRQAQLASPLKQTHITRSRRPEVFCKKDVLANFVKFTGK